MESERSSSIIVCGRYKSAEERKGFSFSFPHNNCMTRNTDNRLYNVLIESGFGFVALLFYFIISPLFKSDGTFNVQQFFIALCWTYHLKLCTFLHAINLISCPFNSIKHNHPIIEYYVKYALVKQAIVWSNFYTNTFYVFSIFNHSCNYKNALLDTWFKPDRLHPRGKNPCFYIYFFLLCIKGYRYERKAVI